MDRNINGSCEKYSSEVKSAKALIGGDTAPDDFLLEFFPELKASNSAFGVQNSTKDTDYQFQDLSNNFQKRGHLQNGKVMMNGMNGHTSIVDELSAKNEQLKTMNKELEDQNIMQESQIAKYEVDLSEKMQDLLSTKLDLETIKIRLETTEKENTELREKVNHYQAQIYQLRELDVKKSAGDSEIAELQKEISTKDKMIRKQKNDIENANRKLLELKRAKTTNKRIWRLIIEFGEALSKTGALSTKHKNMIVKEFTSSEIDLDEELTESVKSLLHGLTASTEVHLANNSEIVDELPAVTSHTLLRPHANIPVTSTPVAKLQNGLPANNVAKNSPVSKGAKQQRTNSQDINSSVPTSASGNSISSNGRSYGSNYFMKTYKDVIEDPYVLEDCLDTLTELRDLRQQFATRNDNFAPLSPLPPTPPPKNATKKTPQKIKPSDKSEQDSPSSCSRKRLNFCHQQSQGFDVQSNQSIEQTSSLNEEQSVSLPQPSDNKYRLSSKRNLDGSLKLDFNASLNTQFLFDLNTLQVSCTIMPFDQTQNNCSDQRSSLPQSLPPLIPITVTPAYNTATTSVLSSPSVTTESSSQRMLSNRQVPVISKSHNFNTSSVQHKTHVQEIISDSNEDHTSKSPKKFKFDNSSSQNLTANDLVSSSSSEKKIRKHRKHSHNDNVDTNMVKMAEVELLSNGTSVENNTLIERDCDKPTSAFVTTPSHYSLRKKSQLTSPNSDVPSQYMPVSDSAVVNLNQNIAFEETAQKADKQKIEKDTKVELLLTNNECEFQISPNSGKLATITPEEHSSQAKQRKRIRKEARDGTDTSSLFVKQPIISGQISDGKVIKKKKQKKSKHINHHNDKKCDAKKEIMKSVSNGVKAELEIENIINNCSTSQFLTEHPEINESSLPATEMCKSESSDTVIDTFIQDSPQSPEKESCNPICEADLKKEALEVEIICSVEAEGGNNFASPLKEETLLKIQSEVPSFMHESNVSHKIEEATDAIIGMPSFAITDMSNTPTEEQFVISSSTQEIEKNENTNDAIDFTGISVNPFSPGTFTPRGLFSTSLQVSTNEVKFTNTSKTLMNDSAIKSPSEKAESNCHLQNIDSCSPSSYKNDKETSIILKNKSGNVVQPKVSDMKDLSVFDVNDSQSLYADNSLIHQQSSVKSDEISRQPVQISYQENMKSHNGSEINGLINPTNVALLESDGEHDLYIAETEDVEVQSFSNVNEEINMEQSSSKSSRKSSSGKAKRKRKAKKLSATKNTKEKNMSSTGLKVDCSNQLTTITIETAFKSLDAMKFTDMHYKQNQHTLFNALINPNNASTITAVIYPVLKYLCSSRANPMLNYYSHPDPINLLPLSEKCIASVLISINRKKLHRFEGLLESTVRNMYDLILAREKFTIYGLSSLTRVMTEICKSIKDYKKPLMLCSELLKIQHKYTPYLIASIAGVWKELFDVTYISDEEMLFHSAITYGVQKKPQRLTEQQWKLCNRVFATHLSAPILSRTKEIIALLVEAIQVKCLNDTLDDEYILTTPLIVLAAVEGWDWIKVNLIDEYIIPLMVRFSEHAMNEKAFFAFCQIYVDICYFCPDEEDPHDVLINFYNNEPETEDGNFVKDAVAMAQIKLLLLKHQLWPTYLTEWMGKNQYKKEKKEYAFPILNRRAMRDNDKSELDISEIL